MHAHTHRRRQAAFPAAVPQSSLRVEKQVHAPCHNRHRQDWECVVFFCTILFLFFFSIEIKRKKQPQQQIKLMKSQRRGRRLPVRSHALCKWVFIHLISLLPPCEGPLVERVQGFSSSFLFCWKKIRTSFQHGPLSENYLLLLWRFTCERAATPACHCL